jgi:hypothetical protein
MSQETELDHSITGGNLKDPPILGVGFVIAAIVGVFAAGICLIAVYGRVDEGRSVSVSAVQTLIYCVAVMCAIAGWSWLEWLDHIVKSFYKDLAYLEKKRNWMPTYC